MTGFVPLATTPLAGETTSVGGASLEEEEAIVAKPLPEAVAGTSNDDAEALIRKHLPMAFRGTAWSAIIAALATGDRYNFDLARTVFDQLFLSSASGIYLDRRAGREGVERPAGVGMSDELFRRLAIEQSTGKLTYQSLIDVLEIFYGIDAVSASATTGVSEPFALEDGHTLTIRDGRETLHVTFLEDDFREIDEASAVEVAAVINRACSLAKFPAWARAVVNPATNSLAVRVYSRQKGLGSQLTVVGGLAQNSLRFPTPVLALPVSTQVSITNPDQGVARFAVVNNASPLLSGVREGDTVNITANVFSSANRGSFTVKRVRVTWNGSSWTQWFEVENESVVVEGVLALNYAGDIEFFRPTRASVYTAGSVPVVVGQAEVGRFQIALPVTTQVVGRSEGTGAYLQTRNLVSIDSVRVFTNGTAEVTTLGDHGLGVGNQIILDDLVPVLIAPSLDSGTVATTGNPGTTDASQMSIWSAVRSDLGARHWAAGTQLANGDVLVCGGHDGTSFLGDSLRFRITSSATISGGQAIGRQRHTYNWVATSAIGFAETSAEHRLTALHGTMSGYALLTGGRASSTARATHKAMLYASSGDAWTDVPNGTLDSRFGHVAVRVQDAAGDDVVFLVGGQIDGSTSRASVQRFRSTAGGTIDTVFTETAGRFRAAGASVGAGKWVVAGGATTPGSESARSDSVGYDEVADAQLIIGPMSLARMDHAAVSPADGQIMVIGGLGRNPTNETADRVLGECEILDVSTKRWRPAGRLAKARRLPIVHVDAGKVYVFGGLDASGNVVETAEVYTIATGRWAPAPAPVALPENGVAISMDQGLLHHGGRHSPSAASAVARLFIPGSNVITPYKSLSVLTKVATVTDPTHFTLAVENAQAAQLAGGQLEKMGATTGAFRGPFVWDPDTGAAVTGVTTTSSANINAFAQMELLEVADATQFPDEPGWLAIGFGTSLETLPVPYLGRASNTTLILDYGFRWPRSIPSGTAVIFLAQRHPFTPASSSVGSFFLTASAAGRIAAETSLDNAVAGGLDAVITIRYPGDKGLGGEGRPVTGDQKISDRVYVWGGDSPDTEVAEAREA
jgi:hypothetical protein